MRTLRKVMLGASVSALALVAAGGVNAKAEGESASVSKFTVTGQQTMDVEWSGGDLFVSFDAYKKDAVNPKATWNLYEGTEVSADLSALKTTKDAFIAVKVGTGDPTIYKIAGGKPEKIKATYNPQTGKLSGVDGKDLEFRTATSDWDTFANGTTDLSIYEQQGATLYFRTAGKDYTTGTPDKKEGFSLGELKDGAFASKEFKVKIPKKAKGPAVKVDYVKGTIAKPTKEVEIKNGSAFAKMTEDAKLNLDEGGVALIRTAATEKKPASNPVVITYKLDDAPAEGDVKIEYTKGKTQGKGSVSISGKSGVTYVVYESGKEREGGKPLATIKGKPVKIAESKLPSGKDLVVAIAADAKNGKFQTDVITLAEAADITAGLKVETATAAPSATPGA